MDRFRFGEERTYKETFHLFYMFRLTDSVISVGLYGINEEHLTLKRLCVEGIGNGRTRWNGSITLVHHLGDEIINVCFNTFPGAYIFLQIIHAGNLTNPRLKISGLFKCTIRQWALSKFFLIKGRPALTVLILLRISWCLYLGNGGEEHSGVVFEIVRRSQLHFFKYIPILWRWVLEAYIYPLTDCGWEIQYGREDGE